MSELPRGAPFEITLPLEDWAHVVAGMIWLTQTNLPEPEREHYRRVGEAIADATPKGSLPWWGAGMLRRG
jgi:hypothetical protein